MSNKNIKAPYECMELKEYKLSDFIPEFFLNSVNMMIFLDLVVKNIADNLYQAGKKRKKLIFEKQNQYFIQVVNQKMLLKMELTKGN